MNNPSHKLQIVNWEKILKIIIKFSKIGFITAGFALIILSYKPQLWEIWTNPLFMGITAIISGFLLMLPRFIYKNSWLKNIYSIHLLYFIQLIILIGLYLNAIGALGFYLNLKYYDTFAHFTAGIIYSFGLYFIYLIYPSPKKAYLLKEQRKALVFTIFMFFSFALLWEFYEYYGDVIFKTQMFGEPGERLDTQIDITASVIGSFIGIIIAHYNAKKLVKYFSIMKTRKQTHFNQKKRA